MKATALVVVTFFVRPSVFLVLGVTVGYTIGFTDAFRDRDTIGHKAARAIYKLRPEAVSAGIYQRASTIRDTVHAKIGVAPATDSLPY
jgi:hypothetical protein